MNALETIPSILIIGVGNLYRSDDAVGILTARRLRESANDRLAIEELSGEGTSLMEAWKDHEQVIVVDAVSSGSAVGTIHRLEANAGPMPSNFFSCSTHNFGIAEAIELSRCLNKLPTNLWVYGIEGKQFQQGQMLSPEVECAMGVVINEILEKVQ